MKSPSTVTLVWPWSLSFEKVSSHFSKQVVLFALKNQATVALVIISAYMVFNCMYFKI